MNNIMYLHWLFMFAIFASVKMQQTENSVTEDITTTGTYIAHEGSKTREGYEKTYTCHECDSSACFSPYNTTCTSAFACFTAVALSEEKSFYYKRGCYQHYFVKISYCDYKNEYLYKRKEINCCLGDFCNVDDFPSIPSHWYEIIAKAKENKPCDTKKVSKKRGRIPKHRDTEEVATLSEILSPEYADANEDDSNHVNVPVYAVPLVSILTILFMVICYFGYIRIKKMVLNNRLTLPKFTKKTLLTTGFLSASDSRSFVTLNQRCLAQDVTLIKCIGQGRYGEVWQGVWHKENVAVKIFPSKDETSWQNEVNIYTNIALYHENLLGFKGSVITTRYGVTEMWLLTAYHQKGSLYDYLLENTITLNEMMEFNRSICSGLMHLHAGVFGSKGKPAIAHRDLKTRNILLTSYGTCMIADFGLAVVKTNEFPSADNPINYKVGTKRYMAPEILDDSIRINSFESFKRADIYAFGLILWEICSRYITNGGTAEAYRPPFHDSVPTNPDFEDMKKVVCVESKRPEIPKSWSSDKTLTAMANLMNECWHESPDARATVYRVKKILERINADVQELN